MASEAVKPPLSISIRRERLFQEWRRLRDEMQAIDRELTDLERGIIHAEHDRREVPAFVLKETTMDTRRFLTCAYPSCLDGGGRCHAMFKGECAGPNQRRTTI